MNRRAVIRDFLIVSAGIRFLPSCVQHEENKVAAVTLKNVKLSSDQQALIAELSESIIPATNTPGAKDLGVPSFCLTMLDDCAEKKDQEKYVKGLDAFDAYARKKFNNSFVKCTTQQKESMLDELSKGKHDPNDDMNFFFNATKWLTVEGYRNSEYYLTKVDVYKLVPGHNYKGCVPVTKS